MTFKFALIALGSATGAVVILVAAQVRGEDPALMLANLLGLGSGVALGAIFGAILGLWIGIGGRSRMAGVAGWMIALAAGVGLWDLGSDAVWILEVILVGIFGPAAAGFAPFVGIGLLIATVRAIASLAGDAARALLHRLPRADEARRERPEAAEPATPQT